MFKVTFISSNYVYFQLTIITLIHAMIFHDASDLNQRDAHAFRVNGVWLSMHVRTICVDELWVCFFIC